MDSASLKTAVAYMDATFGPVGAKQLVIVRNGYPMWEGPQADSRHAIHSCTKVFTSTCLGLALDDALTQEEKP